MSERKTVLIGRWVGVDYGTKRIGLALGDAETGIGNPTETLEATGTPAGDAKVVLQWAAEQDATRFVVGLPLNMDGTTGPQAKLTEAFGRALTEVGARQVEYWDERLSSYQADQYLKEGGVHWSQRKGLRDAVAANVILMAFFGSLRGPGSEGARERGS